MTPGETIVRIRVGLLRGTRALVTAINGNRIKVRLRTGLSSTYLADEVEVVT